MPRLPWAKSAVASSAEAQEPAAVAEEAQPAAAAASEAPAAPAEEEGEWVQVLLQHGKNEREITVTVHRSSSMLEVRKAVAVRLGLPVTSSSQVKLMPWSMRRGFAGAHLAYRDRDKLGSRRQLILLGVDVPDRLPEVTDNSELFAPPPREGAEPSVPKLDDLLRQLNADPEGDDAVAPPPKEVRMPSWPAGGPAAWAAQRKPPSAPSGPASEADEMEPLVGIQVVESMRTRMIPPRPRPYEESRIEEEKEEDEEADSTKKKKKHWQPPYEAGAFTALFGREETGSRKRQAAASSRAKTSVPGVPSNPAELLAASVPLGGGALASSAQVQPEAEGEAEVEPVAEEVDLGPFCGRCHAGVNKSFLAIKPLKCQDCQQVYYCSRKCQREHWTEHQKVCGKTPEEIEAARRAEEEEEEDDTGGDSDDECYVFQAEDDDDTTDPAVLEALQRVQAAKQPKAAPVKELTKEQKLAARKAEVKAKLDAGDEEEADAFIAVGAKVDRSAVQARLKELGLQRQKAADAKAAAEAAAKAPPVPKKSDLKKGLTVCIHGYTGFMADLNDKMGKLDEYVEDMDKWFVNLDGGHIETVEPEHLMIVT